MASGKEGRLSLEGPASRPFVKYAFPLQPSHYKQMLNPQKENKFAQDIPLASTDLSEPPRLTIDVQIDFNSPFFIFAPKKPINPNTPSPLPPWHSIRVAYYSRKGQDETWDNVGLWKYALFEFGGGCIYLLYISCGNQEKQGRRGNGKQGYWERVLMEEGILIC